MSNVLFYPAAGFDLGEIVTAFRSRVDQMVFSDTSYRFDSSGQSRLFEEARISPSQVDLRGPAAWARSRQRAGGRSRSWIEPGWLTARPNGDERVKEIVFRRGFSQFALRELGDRSIRVFVHRGDSPGESGSNTLWFENRTRSHPPLSNLFDGLCSKLADTAWVITDGSNVGTEAPEPLRRHHRSTLTSAEAFADLQGERFDYGPFRWSCVDHLGPRYGPTIIWQVERKITETPYSDRVA